MTAKADLGEAMQCIDATLASLTTSLDASARAAAQSLASAILEVDRYLIMRLVEALGATPAGQRALAELSREEVTASVFLLHDITVESVERSPAPGHPSLPVLR